MSVRPAKTQISLGIRPDWSESSLCAQWVAKGPSFLHANSEDSDQTGRMPRLIWVFAGRTLILLVLSCRWWLQVLRTNRSRPGLLCLPFHLDLLDKIEPRHDKTNKVTVCPAKTQISLGIRPVWSESSLCALGVAKDPSFLHTDSEDSDQNRQMPRLI